MMDLAPTLLHGMGLPVPRSMDGQVLHELFEPEFNAGRTVERIDWQGATAASGLAPYSEEDERIVREQLRRLGYIE